ncbi:syntaphilin isoform X1 [Hippocampus comes]|uniref:syntaphilin isoform X1 n=2 Tax=Hippocampus comes TaxID=109280 RepID=UPI00094E10D0|nr:PREDICTED: syntaphilin-like isoform X1 [Hippocampus comes]XP_019720803.1 PREDICTED: syntaphilin-like isoform X1 [Hippocampus comes]XP_019720805.1 PREDICTED: syntaphilin-like isoform X1 [Hippocampus comes]XP_019720806.1 PREDICTED: syntaphilin-like isoform X1 [Hippocampus comes]
MSLTLTPSRKPSLGQRRRSAGTSGSSGRCTHTDMSSTSNYPLKVKATEGSLTPRIYPTTPRRQAKHTICSDNHGIRPPAPEQYLTPLQQKEVSIRHLRARLRDNMERLQHRDYEIDELRTQLYRMQEDWIEEECHRVEAQLALKEARKEIQHLQEVVESVRSNLGVWKQDHDHKPYTRSQEPRLGGRSRSCGCSPASTLTRSRHLSGEAPQGESSRAPRHLLLETTAQQDCAEGTPPLFPSCDRLCRAGAAVSISHSCHSLAGSCYLPHHHLFLHLPQEEPQETIASAMTAPADPVPSVPAGRKLEVRSQACSPTMTWVSREERGAEELSIISAASRDVSPAEPVVFSTALPPLSPLEMPCVCQPHPVTPLRQEATVLEMEEGGKEEAGNDDSLQSCHWSPYFLVDLLALAVPVVPTLAWLCRGAPRDIAPVYHIGSLLRGCCAVALHSLRRRRGGPGRGSPSVSGTPI